MTRELPISVTWLDPGKTTGWATLTSYRVLPSTVLPDGWLHSFTGGQTGNLLELGQMLERSNHSSVGWEAYLGSGGTPRHALEVIGAVRYVAMSRRLEILPEAPASSRVVCSDEVLRRLGWWTPGKEHANDAARHLVAWLRREGLMRERLDEVFTSLLS